MKLTIALFLFGLVSVSASTYAQNTKMDISLKNSNIVELFKEIEQKSEFYFFYQKEELKNLDAISVNMKGATVTKILDKALKGSPLTYKIIDRYIIIRNEGESRYTEKMAQQQKAISGTVTDNSGQPLPGVTVVIKGTTQGTVTDMDGNYSVSNIPENATLVFSFVGMRTQEIIVGDQTSINIILAQDVIGIEEVVAIGYGTVKKSDLTGAISVVNTEKLKELPVASIDQKIKGQIPGVRVQQITGIPGGGTSVQIRGVGSLGAGNEPLYVIDGIPYSTGSNQRINPLIQINPNNIESVTVLKDASSTAIYGSRGANGVIIYYNKKRKLQ